LPEPVSQKKWSILELITWGTSYLAEKGVDEARLTIELLLSHVLKLKRIHLYTNFDRPLIDSELAEFKGLLLRRRSREPLQYILGETEFMGHRIFVDPRVLIPRPETELLTERVVSECRNRSGQGNSLRILEIGTGSGCIAVALAAALPLVSVTSIDCSADALDLAQQNAEFHSLTDRIRFRHQDFLSDSTLDEKFDFIISNPPYISTQEYELLDPEVKNFEPKIALADGSDGLTFYKTMAERGAALLKPGGKIAVEHAFDQSASVRKIFHDSGWENIEAMKDFSGHDRYVTAEGGSR
jgi:release factor glutamine methyltransferase